MRLLLIRHGQTPSNLKHLLDTEAPGPTLTPLGQEQAPARLAVGVRRGRGDGWPFRGGCVGDLDADQAQCLVEAEPEVAVVARYAAVPHGVSGEFADDEGDRARRVRRRRVTPLLHAPHSETSREPCASGRGSELRCERGAFL